MHPSQSLNILLSDSKYVPIKYDQYSFDLRPIFDKALITLKAVLHGTYIKLGVKIDLEEEFHNSEIYYPGFQNS